MLRVIAILDELKSDPLFKYFYEAIEEPAMIFLLERNDIAKNNAIKLLEITLVSSLSFGRLLHIIKEGRLPEDTNETESAISSDSNLSQETPISPVFTNPKGVAMFLYGGAFFAKSDTSVRPITREEYEELPQDLRQIASLEAKGLISYDENPSGEARVEYYTTSGSVSLSHVLTKVRLAYSSMTLVLMTTLLSPLTSSLRLQALTTTRYSTT